MPMKPKTPCRQPGCAALTDGGYCERHAKDRQRRYDRERGSSAKRLYGYKWRKARAAYLMAHPFCEPCLETSVTHAATVVDHKVPHRGDPVLFWDQGNWQSMAKTCHDSKTAREDGGWGRGARNFEGARS